MQGNDFDIASTDTTVTVLTCGTGIGTHVGQFSFTQTVTVDFATTGHCQQGLLIGSPPMETASIRQLPDRVK